VSHASRLAVFGDVHGNAPALDAVLRAIAEAGITQAIITGDIVLRGLEPEKCVRRVRKTGWPCVEGNTDRRVVGKKVKAKTDVRDMRPGTRTWTKTMLSTQSLEWLDALPSVVEADLGPHRVVAVHGDQTVPAGLVDHDATDAAIVGVMDALGADVLITAHTHSPMLRWIQGRLVVNPGSVGEGTADDPRPTWAWLEAGKKGIHAAIEHVDQPLAPPRDRAHRKGE
jgi:putative phosphoesterase